MMEFPSANKPLLPHEIKCIAPDEYSSNTDELNRITGSLVGLAVGDALGASVEFRPHQYFVDHPVHDMEGGGTWGLKAGQWTDDTSMSLCLASSLIDKKGFDLYDQMVRYKRWYKHGYMSSTGRCFDIGNATRESIEKFSHRQKILQKRFNCHDENKIDTLSWDDVQSVTEFDINCSSTGVAGNGALMRLTPVPLFFYRSPIEAVENAGRSARCTHGDKKAVDACRYYAALIVAAVSGESKSDLLQKNFYETHRSWFGTTDLHDEILRVAHGSYQRKNGYEDGIRGKGYIVNALEAALWALWSDNDSFEEGALAAVNLGDDTDTTAAIYGQLAGAVYGYKKIPQKWIGKLYARELLVCIGKWLYFEGNQYKAPKQLQKTVLSVQTPVVISSNYHQKSSINESSVNPPNISPTRTYPSDDQKLSVSRLDALELPRYLQKSNETQRHQPNDILLSSFRPGVHQASDPYLDVKQSRTSREYAGQSSTRRPYEYQSSEYQSESYQSPAHQSDPRQLSTFQEGNYNMPAYGSNFGQLSNHYSGNQGISAHISGITQPPAYDTDVIQSSTYRLNDKKTLIHRPSESSPRMYPAERVSHVNNTGEYPYTADQIRYRSSMNADYMLDHRDRSHQSEGEAYNRSRRTEDYNYQRPAASYHSEYRQPISHSPHTTIVRPSSQRYFISGGKIHWY